MKDKTAYTILGAYLLVEGTKADSIILVTLAVGVSLVMALVHFMGKEEVKK